MPLPSLFPPTDPTVRLNSLQTPLDHYIALANLEANGIALVDLPLNAEDDNWLHRPITSRGSYDNDGGDGERYIDLCAPWALLNVGGMVLLTLGVVGVFVGVPLVAFLRRAAAGR